MRNLVTIRLITDIQPIIGADKETNETKFK